jgi:starvation-inducible DNA-binding protein
MAKSSRKQDAAARTRIDIAPKTRSAMQALLNRQLADMVDLHSQLKQAHWNVKGPHFIALHELFDKLAELLESSIDDVAERIAALGGMARGTVRMAAAGSRLPELPNVQDGLALVAALADHYAALAKSTRAAIEISDDADDEVTSDLVTRLCGEFDKALWLLEAHLAK